MPLVESKRKPSVAYRKSQALHHHKGKSYLKAYWPYIPFLMIFGFALIFNYYWHLGSREANTNNFTQTSLINYTNQIRQNNSVAVLNNNPLLQSAAQDKADSIAASNIWSHTQPGSPNPWQDITDNGYNYSQVGENLAYGFSSAKQVVNSWVNTPKFKASVLNKNYQDMGVGISQSDNFMGHGPAVIVVADYASPTSGNVNLAASNNDLNIQPASVTRMNALSPTNFTFIAAFSILLISVVIIWSGNRHLNHVKSLAKKSELFIMHHPMLDIFICLYTAMLIILSSSAGHIL